MPKTLILALRSGTSHTRSRSAVRPSSRTAAAARTSAEPPGRREISDHQALSAPAAATPPATTSPALVKERAPIGPSSLALHPQDDSGAVAFAYAR